MEDDGRCSDIELELPKPQQESTQEQRQSTYRSNGVSWIKSRPHGALWSYRTNMRVQQSQQKKSILHAGDAHQKQEWLRREKGKPARHLPVLAYDGYFTKEFKQQYWCIANEPGPWEGMPDCFRTHEFASSFYSRICNILYIYIWCRIHECASSFFW